MPPGHGPQTVHRREPTSQVVDARGNAGANNGREVLADVLRVVLEDGGEYGFIVLRADGRIATWNAAATETFRLDNAAAIDRPIAALYPPAEIDAGIPQRDLRLASETGIVERDALRVRADGTPFHVKVVLVAVRGKSGALDGFFHLFHASPPCTRPPSISQKYRETLEQADVVLKGVADGIVVGDAAGRLLYVNDAAANAVGFTSASELLASDSAYVQERFVFRDENGVALNASELPAAQALANETAEPKLVNVHDRSNGQSWWALVRASAVRNEAGQPELAISVWHDVTEEYRQKHAARLLADATSRLAESLEYATTLASVAEALVPEFGDWCTVDLVEDGSRRKLAVAHADPSKLGLARRLVAHYASPDDAPVGVPKVLRTGHPELYSSVPDALLVRSSRNEEHLQLLRALAPRSAMIVPITVGDRTEGAISLVSESERRYDARDLDLACEIGRRAGRAIEHARLYRSAQHAVKVRDEFLSIAGHELRTPLAALSLQLENMKVAIERGTFARDPSLFVTRIDKTLGHTQRLARLIDGLLNVSRVSSGKLELQRTRVDVAALLRDICERFAHDASRAGSSINLYAPLPCFACVDADGIDQAVSSLLSNAIKYGAGKPVDVSCVCGEKEVVFTIADRGIGIAVLDQERIFGRFERAVSERNYGGLGLGLWLARQIVLGHGGQIAVTSAKGEGATFMIRLARETEGGAQTS